MDGQVPRWKPRYFRNTSGKLENFGHAFKQRAYICTIGRKFAIFLDEWRKYCICQPECSFILLLVNLCASWLGQAEQLHLAEKISMRPFLALEDLNEMPYASKVRNIRIFFSCFLFFSPCLMNIFTIIWSAYFPLNRLCLMEFPIFWNK